MYLFQVILTFTCWI